MQWTNNQKEALDTENKNILISASAGAGKTKVLVEKICKCVIQGTNIRDILVMTFTNDATNEMKNRIRIRLDELINEFNEKGENSIVLHLLDQKNMLSQSNISTIDSFCKKIVDENFVSVDKLDPNYKVGDENEFKIIISEILDEFFEEKASNNFFADFFKTYFKKNKKTLIKMFNDGLRFLSKQSFPMKFLEYHLDEQNSKKLNNLIFGELKTNLSKKFYKKVCLQYEIIKNNFDDFINCLHEGTVSVSEKNKQKFLYFIDFIQQSLMSTENLINNYDENNFFDAFNNFDETKYIFENTRTNVQYTIGNGDKKKLIPHSYIKTLRDEIFAAKKHFENVNKILKFNNENINFYDMDTIYLKLLKDFYIKFEDYKIKNNIIEISDFQKYALKILYDENKIYYNENGIVYDKNSFSEKAYFIQHKYKKIFVDEYQDTSYSQEMLIKALSNDFENNNVFMVGDIKQSIYAFRNAVPSLFSKKLD